MLIPLDEGHELARPAALYLKASVAGELAGYVGLWHYAGEGHICTLAVARSGGRGGAPLV